VEIGRKIYYSRHEKGMSQQELARGICTVSYLSKIENNRAEPHQDIIDKLFAKLGIANNEKTIEELETINNRLKNWYEIIRRRDIEKATKEEKEITLIVNSLKEPSILINYHIFSAKYLMLLNKFDEAENIIKQVELQKKLFTNEQNYYFHLVDGIYKYSKNRFIDSLQSFTIAEKIVKEIKVDETELFYLLALNHSRLYHVTLAIHYGSIALANYDKVMDNIKSIETRIILSINYIRIKDYDSAYLNLTRSLKVAEGLNDEYLIGNVKHNMGYLFSKKEQHKEAIKYYLESLNNKEEASETYLTTLFYLAQEYFKIKDLENAKYVINNGLKLATEINTIIYLNKFKVLYYQNLATDELSDEYQEHLEETVIPYFTKQENWVEVSQYAEALANYYSEDGKHKQASFFYKLAYESIKKTIM